MLKINLLPRIASRLVRKPSPDISISRRSIQSWAQQAFGISDPRLFMAVQTNPQQNLIDLKNEMVEALRAKQRYVAEEIQVLEQAFDLMLRFHGTEALPGGERVAIHLLEVARTLCEWGSSPLVAAAGLLHLIPPAELEGEGFAKDVVYLVQAKNALGNYLFAKVGIDKLSGREARYLSKMCLMQEGDRNVWLLEAADEFRTLTSLSDLGREATLLASRAYHVTSPTLSRFDLDDIAVRLENIAFMRLDKEAYERIERIITDTNTRNRLMALDLLRALTELISGELQKAEVLHRVQVDVKSVTRTMKKLDKGDTLTDASRFRVIIDGPPEQCQQAMEIIKLGMEQLGYIEDLSERKNYVAGITLGEKFDLGPKRNSYQSIHLHFRGERNEPINVQIRTEAMHEVAELGSASHGRFKLDGLVQETVVSEASVERDRLLNEGRRYGIFSADIYRLIPYPSGKKIRLIDLLFAVSPETALRAPDKVVVERRHPLNSETLRLKLPITAPLENGDRILPYRKHRGLSPGRIRSNQLGTLRAQVAHRLARVGKLDPALIQERSSSAESNGKAALGLDLSNWRSQLRQRFTTLLRNDGENIASLKIETLFSLERAAKGIGMESEAGMHLAVGLASKRERLIEQVMNIVQASSTAIAYKVFLADPSRADLWLMVYDVPGVVPAALNLMTSQRFQLFRFSSRPLSGGFALIKVRIKTRKKSIEEDLFDFLAAARDLYQTTRPRYENLSQTRFTLSDLRPARSVLKSISNIVSTLEKLRAKIISSRFLPVLEKRASSRLTVEVPAGFSETFKRRLRDELKKVGINNFRLLGR